MSFVPEKSKPAMGITAYLPSWRRKPEEKVKGVDYKEIIGDEDLVQFFEASTPSIRRDAVLQSTVAVGVTKESAEQLVARRTFSVRPLPREERKKLLAQAAEENCVGFRPVIHECLELRPDWRNGLSPQEIAEKESACDKVMERHATCVSAQTKIMYALGYKLSKSDLALDDEVKYHAMSLYMRVFGTPRHPRQPTVAQLARIDSAAAGLDKLSTP